MLLGRLLSGFIGTHLEQDEVKLPYAFPLAQSEKVKTQVF
jgi:hypothetical protein